MECSRVIRRCKRRLMTENLSCNHSDPKTCYDRLENLQVKSLECINKCYRSEGFH